MAENRLSLDAQTGPVPRWPMPALIRASVGIHALAGVSALLLPGAWPWALGAVLANHGVLGSAGLWPRSDWLGPNVSRLPAAASARGAVALTLDDGPDPDVTPRVLDVLDAAQASATFFCIAQRAQAAPALVREIMRRGHSVQNHSHRHAHHFALLGPGRLAREIDAAQQALADITGEWPHCFRAPAGLRNPMLDPVLHRQGLHLVSWTRRGFDTRDQAPAKVLARLQRGLAAGSILLLHDGHAGHTPQGQPLVLAVLPALLQQLRERGLHAETLRQALPRRHEPVPAGRSA